MRFLLILLTCTLFSCHRHIHLDLPKSENPIHLWDAAWSPDGQYVAIGGDIDTLCVLSAKSYEVVKLYPIKRTITKLRWHPSEPILAVATQLLDDGLVLINTQTDERQYIPNIAGSGGRGLAWNPTGEILAFGDNEGDLSFFNTQGQLLRKVSTGQKAVIDLSWHPYRNELLTVSEYISRYDYDKDEFLSSIEDRPEETLMLCVAWHPSGELFVTGDYGDFIQNYPPLLQFWDADGKNLRKIDVSAAEFRNLRWSPDGSVLASTSEAIRLWSVDGKLLHEQPTPLLLWGVDWRPDGKVLVTSGEGGTVNFWNRKLRPIIGTPAD